jgi:hypothetical protein
MFVTETTVLPHLKAVSIILHNVRHTHTNTITCELQKKKKSSAEQNRQAGQAKSW